MKKHYLLVSVLTFLPALAMADLNVRSPQDGATISSSSTTLTGSCEGNQAVSLSSYIGTASASCSNNQWSFNLSGVYSKLKDGDLVLTLKQGSVTASVDYTINKNPAPAPVIPSAKPAIITITSPETLTEGETSSAVFTPNTSDFVGDINFTFKYRDEALGDIVFSSGVVHFTGTQTTISVPLKIINDGVYSERSLVGEFSTTKQNATLANSSTTTEIIDVNGNEKLAIVPVKNTNYTGFVSSIDGDPVITTTVTIVPVSGNLTTPLINALKVATPGTRIIIPDGIYKDQLFNFSKANCPAGAPNRPIIIQAATPGGVIFKERSGFLMCGAYIVVQGVSFVGPVSNTVPATVPATPFKVGTSFNNVYRFCDYCALRKILVDSYTVTENPDLGGTWIYVSADDSKADYPTSKGLELSDSRFINKANYGTILYWQASQTPAAHHIYRNYFSRPVPTGKDDNGLEAIRVGDSFTSSNTSNAIIEHNVFENANGDAEDISLKSNGNIVRYNTFITSGGTLSIRIGNKNVLEGNYFVGRNVAKTGGIRISGTDNIALGNHFEGLNYGGTKADPGTTNLIALGLYNGDGKPCTGAAYCAVVRAFAVGNFFFRNNTNIVMGAAAYGDKTIAPSETVIARNVFDTTTTTSSMIFNRNANLSGYVIDNNRGAGKAGVTVTNKELEVLSSIETNTFGPLSIKIPQTKKDQYNLRMYRKRLVALGLGDEMLSKVNMLEKNIYEISTPLTSKDVGLTDSDY